MANPEHLEILKQGVEAWNEWRKGNPEIIIDLTRANLTSADLNGANLNGADLRQVCLTHTYLSGARLSDADLRNAILDGADLTSAYLSCAILDGAGLRGADLNNADLTRAYLNNADLNNADLNNADLSGADLNNADLSGALIIRTNLRSAHLSGANFTDVTLGQVTFGNNDLSQVKGLETTRHIAPSTIGIDTLYESRGNIPEIFLRRCGVPESFIVQVHALIASTQPIQFYSCFISYSSKDQDFAERLYADLQNKGVRCWFAPEDIKIGDRFRIKIDESIRVYDKLLLVLSENSVASSWVEKEVETAMEREVEDAKHRTVLFPVRLDDAVMKIKTGWPADVRRTRHIGDFTDWKNHDSYQKAFDRLLRDLKAEEKKARTRQTGEG